MSRKPNEQTFRRTDFFRAVDAARARDLPIAAVEATRTPDGVRTVKVIVGEPWKDADTSAPDTPESIIEQL
jgi:hypothetical protein